MSTKTKPHVSQAELTETQKLQAEWSRVLPSLSSAEIAAWMEKRPGPPPESESAFWLAELPPPPAPLHSADEDDVLIWLRAVAAVGGMPALQFAWDPGHWPFGSYLRSRCTHLHGTVCREIEAESKRKAEEAARENAEKQRDAMRELFRVKGWR